MAVPYAKSTDAISTLEETLKHYISSSVKMISKQKTVLEDTATTEMKQSVEKVLNTINGTLKYIKQINAESQKENVQIPTCLFYEDELIQLSKYETTKLVGVIKAISKEVLDRIDDLLGEIEKYDELINHLVVRLKQCKKDISCRNDVLSKAKEYNSLIPNKITSYESEAKSIHKTCSKQIRNIKDDVIKSVLAKNYELYTKVKNCAQRFLDTEDANEPLIHRNFLFVRHQL